MKKLLLGSAVFTVGAVFGLALAAVVALGLSSPGNTRPIPISTASGTPDVVVTISETHINNLLQAELRNLPHYKNVRLRIEKENLLTLSGDTSLGGIPVPLTVRGQLYSDGEAIKVKIVETRLGILSTKIDVSQVIDAPLAAATKSMIPLGQYRISGVSTEQGRVTVELVQK